MKKVITIKEIVKQVVEESEHEEKITIETSRLLLEKMFGYLYDDTSIDFGKESGVMDTWLKIHKLNANSPRTQKNDVRMILMKIKLDQKTKWQ